MWYLNYKNHQYWAYMEHAFSSDECDKIVKYADDNLLFENASLIGGSFDDSIRKNSVAWIDPKEQNIEWVYRKLTDCINFANGRYWQYDIDYLEKLQFTRYQHKNDGYKAHIDIAVNPINYRKISFSLQLSDEDSYSGSDLILMESEEGTKTNRKKGTINFFPSYTLHKVSPLISGKRDALVGWVCGPNLK